MVWDGQLEPQTPNQRTFFPVKPDTRHFPTFLDPSRTGTKAEKIAEYNPNLESQAF